MATAHQEVCHTVGLYTMHELFIRKDARLAPMVLETVLLLIEDGIAQTCLRPRKLHNGLRGHISGDMREVRRLRGRVLP